MQRPPVSDRRLHFVTGPQPVTMVPEPLSRVDNNKAYNKVSYRRSILQLRSITGPQPVTGPLRQRSIRTTVNKYESSTSCLHICCTCCKGTCRAYCTSLNIKHAAYYMLLRALYQQCSCQCRVTARRAVALKMTVPPPPPLGVAPGYKGSFIDLMT